MAHAESLDDLRQELRRLQARVHSLEAAEQTGSRADRAAAKGARLAQTEAEEARARAEERDSRLKLLVRTRKQRRTEQIHCKGVSPGACEFRAPTRLSNFTDSFQPRIDNAASVESADRQRDSQRLDQEAHADRRPAGSDREADARGMQLAHHPWRSCSRSSLGEQRAVDVGYNKRNADHGGTVLS